MHVLCETTCQIVAWYEHGQHRSAATQRLRLYTVAQKAKQNKTKGGVLLRVEIKKWGSKNKKEVLLTV